jgi:hypothetical protein
MKTIWMASIVFVVMQAHAQVQTPAQMPTRNPTLALENKPHSLSERYYLMKTNSESYQDYRVIREYIMDAVWKYAMDSLTKKTNQLAETNAKIKSLEADVTRIQSNLQAKETSMNEVVFASTHINVIGKNFPKTSFLIICAVTVAALVALIFFLLTRMKLMQMFVAESKVVVASITHEFNDYKRTALDKEIKLSRELQTERNKLMELKTKS